MGFEPKPVSMAEVFPFTAEGAAAGGSVSVCNDGAGAMFFEFESRAHVGACIETIMGDGELGRMTVQLYKLRHGGEDRYFGCVKVYLDYSFLSSLTWRETVKRFFVGNEDILRRFEGVMSDMIDVLLKKLGAVRVLPLQREESPVHRFLLDSSRAHTGAWIETRRRAQPEAVLASRAHTGAWIETVVDVSAIKVGERRFLGMFSLVAPHLLRGLEREVLTEIDDAMWVETICIPSAGYGEKHERYFSELYKLISNVSDGMLDVALAWGRGLKQIMHNNTIIVSGKSDETLTAEVDEARALLLDCGLVSYMHTSSAREHYISCFPGNGERGYYYQSGFLDCSRARKGGGMVNTVERFFKL